MGGAQKIVSCRLPRLSGECVVALELGYRFLNEFLSGGCALRRSQWIPIFGIEYMVPPTPDGSTSPLCASFVSMKE
jgi:hypothetical protein